jgi:chromosome segregation ATPase
MEKKELGVGQYVTTGTAFIRGEFKPEKKKLVLSEQRKEAILEYLKESDEFHKLICDITGVERKQQKVSAELEKLKEEYSHMCESYENEKQQRNDLLRKCREKTVKIMKMQTTLEESCSHHNNMMNRIKDLLKEVDMPSVKHTIEALKTERANGKLLAEDNELCRHANDKLKLNYEKANKELEAQKDLVKKYVAKSEKLQSKLDRASKQYGELIKIISDKAIKSI